MKPSSPQIPAEPADSTRHLDLSKAVRLTLPNLNPSSIAEDSHHLTTHKTNSPQRLTAPETDSSQGPTARNTTAQGIALGFRSIMKSSPSSGPTVRHTTAQGIALGFRSTLKSSPERAAQMSGEVGE